MLAGEVTDIAELRYTPAGIPVLAFTLKHASQQEEGGMKRQVECEIPAVAMAKLAEQSTSKLKQGSRINASGFIARKSLHSRQLVLHINELEIIEKG